MAAVFVEDRLGKALDTATSKAAVKDVRAAFASQIATLDEASHDSAILASSSLALVESSRPDSAKAARTSSERTRASQ